MERRDFLIEEYRAMQAATTRHQAAYFSLENYTFGGMLVVYGILFGVIQKDGLLHIPLTAWCGVFVLVLIACVRCLGHYLIVRKLAAYIALIEREFYFDNPVIMGFERFHVKGVIGPRLNLAVNAVCWLALLTISAGIAYAKWRGDPIP